MPLFPYRRPRRYPEGHEMNLRQRRDGRRPSWGCPALADRVDWFAAVTTPRTSSVPWLNTRVERLRDMRDATPTPAGAKEVLPWPYGHLEASYSSCAVESVNGGSRRPQAPLPRGRECRQLPAETCRSRIACSSAEQEEGLGTIPSQSMDVSALCLRRNRTSAALHREPGSPSYADETVHRHTLVQACTQLQPHGRTYAVHLKPSP